MATMTYYARGDGLKANNAALNVQNTQTTPVTTLEFSSGISGDLSLDYNDGGFDPDTTVIVNGVERYFSVEFSGNLPNSKKLADVNGEDLRGAQIVVITTDDGQRYVFLLDNSIAIDTISQLPNGAHIIDNLSVINDILLCFARGTLIATPTGEVPVEQLRAGDRVLNEKGRPVPLLWMASRRIEFPQLLCQPEHRPVCIPEGMLGQGLPHRDLWLSPQHRIKVDGWQTEILFRAPAILVAAKHLIDTTPSRPADIIEGVEYYHLLLPRHDVVIANGLPCESLYPGDMARDSFSPEALANVDALLEETGRGRSAYGPTVFPTITGREAGVLCAYLGLAGSDEQAIPSHSWAA